MKVSARKYLCGLLALALLWGSPQAWAALGVATVWEVRSTGSATAGGGFDVGATFTADLTATSGTGTAPVVSSASYTFVAGDVGARVFIKSGTNWIPGWYTIASVSGGSATLTASIGSVSLYGGATLLNTTTGCATTASPTAGTWGADYSQQTTAQFAFTDMVIDGTTNTKFTSAGFPVGKNFIGNIIKVTGGTGFTTQYVEVVSTSGTTATCDKSLGTLSSTGGTGNLGGCLDGLVTLSGAMVASNKAFITGSFTQTATATFAQTVVQTGSVMTTKIVGYGTTRGDGTKATITLATNTGLIAINPTGVGFSIENIAVNCASLGTSIGFKYQATRGYVSNCKVSNFTSNGISSTTFYLEIFNTEVTGGTSASSAGINSSSNVFVFGCNIHDNACPGILAADGAVIEDNLITNNTGAASDGITCSDNSSVNRNTAHGNGRNGILNSGSINIKIKSNIFSSNGGFGAKCFFGAGNPATSYYDGNAYWSNTSGTRSNMDDVGSANPVNGVAPYTNSLDVILTADPFQAKASNDFRLNTTAGGGAACRGFGVPTRWPGNSLTTSFPDMGAAQHKDPASGSKNIESGGRL